MNKEQLQSFILAIIILVTTILLIKYIAKNISFKIIQDIEINEPYINIKPTSSTYTHAKPCKYQINEAIKKIINKYNIKEAHNVSDASWSLYLPCDYNYIDQEIEMIDTTNLSTDKKFFIINNCDELTSKSSIWTHLIQKYGLNGATKIMPKTYRLNEDIDMFNHDFSGDKLYIMKKNIQRQEGLKITNDKQTILNGHKDGYIIVQDLLQNPYLIDGRKTNMRFYLLILTKNNELNAYVHKEGFMYYTKNKFVPGVLDPNVNITTGYIDRSVYDKNPLTLGDLRKHLDKQKNRLSLAEIQILEEGNTISKEVFFRIYKMLAKVVEAVRYKLLAKNKLNDYLCFQIFGVDVALSDTLEPQLMEVNKGPDLGSKDERDGEIKEKVITDIFKLVKIIPGDDYDFIPIVK